VVSLVIIDVNNVIVEINPTKKEKKELFVRELIKK